MTGVTRTDTTPAAPTATTPTGFVPQLDGDPVLVHSVSWDGRVPHLVVSNPLRDGRIDIPLLGERLAFNVDPSGRYCTGVRILSGPDGARHLPCDGARLAVSGGQCERCAAQDASRFMHHAHRGGHVPESLKRSLAQEHWLYIATFADGAHKVGTAAGPRKVVRLDEQGAVRATYIARTDDGYAVRVLEDAVTQHVGLAQTRHKSSKASSLERALPPSTLDTVHDQVVADVANFLRDQAPISTFQIPLERWDPPPVHAAFFAVTHVHPRYPHSLAEGDHCLTPHALVGGVAVAAVNDDTRDDLVLVSLDDLRGRRVTFGEVRSPETAAQHSLF